MIDIKQLSFSYNKKQPILKDINLTIHDFEKVGILGESGSGKSTLAHLILGLLQPVQGQLTCNSSNILPIFQHAYDSFNPDWTIYESLHEALKYYNNMKNDHDIEQSIYDYITKLNLDAQLLQQLPDLLSGGQLQRFNVMRTLLAQPEILICDEITSNLDVIAEQNVIDILKQQDVLNVVNLIIISHDLSVLQRTVERIIVLKDGVIVDDFTTAQLFNSDRHPYTKELIATFN
ncbi:ABC transporter ATP-binding protein [Staphylococcus simiae]|uniref:Putative oligopeptide transporter ATPase n=1 Tax=Staphylococcus simiae CCM 7213 = CCUG 51256 TaxID=911238 RepID=G5JLI0_9STAP|nr:ATP-binding cassette domain-containing protein [Staphylococcus simiae]EHJ06945.1 putative oligopeptide transporter ATPase [Staphylococcus simiae CCM 7213 = CCUG 51256]PNZ14752.1 peptide ABC transporter ATP-binding protein [Staphylococcus simiae]SNV71005.1 ABC-type dipeptide/oligopeptide/nickel transport system, ATP-binding protein [Staphylococcus simiae]